MAAQVAGIFLYLPVQLLTVHQRMQRRLQQSPPHARSLTTMRMSDVQLKQHLVDRNELLYQHQLYDIVRAERVGATWTLYVIADDDESIILETLEAAARELFQQPSAPQKVSFSKLMSLLYIQPAPPHIPAPSSMAVSTYTAFLHCALPTGHTRVSPPPKV